ncbi:MAG: zf-TFIIB domain-containing protein [Myxococcota bacterium]
MAARETPELVKELRRKLLPLPTATPEPSAIESSCPVCARSSMREVELGLLHIDYCAICKGIFLDKGEIDAALAEVAQPGTTLSVLVAVAERAVAMAA